MNDYYALAKYQDFILYLKEDNQSYIIKRLLDNEKEYEYSIFNNNTVQ